MSEKMLVGKIRDGVVIDHISPGKGLIILKLLDSEPDAELVVARNVPSTRFGKKDLIKIEGEYLTSAQIDILGLISPHATINLIENYAVKEKKEVKPPSELLHLLDCKNPKCASKGQFSRFRSCLMEPIEDSYFECMACGHRLFYEEAIEQILKRVSTGVLISRDRVQRELLDLLIKKGGIRLSQSFKLKSGRVRPYFVNLGALTDGESLAKLRWILGGFTWILLNSHAIKDFEFIFGPAYKGINLAALTCQGLTEFAGLNKRFLYDRKETKLYGDTKMDGEIVGGEYFKPGQKIMVVDDTISTGETKLESIKKLSRLSDGEIVGIVVCVDRQESSRHGKSAVEEVKDALGIQIFPILTASIIYSLVKGVLSEQEREAWIDYYDKYGSVRLE